MKTNAMEAGVAARRPQAVGPVELGPSFSRPADDTPEPERKGGWWADEIEAARFLNLKDRAGNWDPQQVLNLANQNLPKRKCPKKFREADVQRLGRGKVRVWCCKPDATGNRRPVIEDRA